MKWYYFFTDKTHTSMQFDDDQAAITCAQAQPEVKRVLRASDSIDIWTRPATESAK